MTIRKELLIDLNNRLLEGTDTWHEALSQSILLVANIMDVAERKDGKPKRIEVNVAQDPLKAKYRIIIEELPRVRGA